jgi:hypothetical protein
MREYAILPAAPETTTFKVIKSRVYRMRDLMIAIQ